MGADGRDHRRRRAGGDLSQDQLAHKHEWTSDEIWLFAMEGAAPGDHEILAEVFSDELRDWVTRRVVVRVE